ncbi:MAG TPA: hypothetical protein VF494_02080 [Candidatus Limnocylindrales bacterium]
MELDRAILGVLLWATLMASARFLVVARVADRTIAPIVGALALGLAMGLAPWIFMAVGAVRPVIGSGLLFSVPGALVVGAGSLSILRSVRDQPRR